MSLSRFARRCGATALIAGLSLPAALPAQSLASQTARLQPPSASGPAHIVSTNPLLPLFGNFAAEYEQRVRDNVAFAVSGSHYSFDEDRFTHLDAKVRLYPNDRALEGFGMAASLGVAWLRQEDDSYFCDAFDCGPRDISKFSTPTFAIELGYQWLLGRSKSTAVTVGVGAKRYLTVSDEDLNGMSRVLPTGRLSIGYGF